MSYFDRGRGTPSEPEKSASDAPAKTCSHIKTNGERCEAFALKTDVFCYYHARSRQRALIVERAHAQRMKRLALGLDATDFHRNRHSDELFNETSASLLMALELPELEDANAIQVTLSVILRALVAQQIDRKSAALALYCCQIATGILPRLHTQPRSFHVIADVDADPLRELVRMLADLKQKKAAARETAESGSEQTEPKEEVIA